MGKTTESLFRAEYGGQEQTEIEASVVGASSALKSKLKLLRKGGKPAADAVNCAYRRGKGYNPKNMAKAIAFLITRTETSLAVAESLAIDNFVKATVFNAGNTYAGVHAPVDPFDLGHTIEIGGNFWHGNPNAQIDTIIHEVSHFHN